MVQRTRRADARTVPRGARPRESTGEEKHAPGKRVMLITEFANFTFESLPYNFYLKKQIQTTQTIFKLNTRKYATHQKL